MKRSAGGATILDIAKKLKISAMTVSRALTGSPEVSDKTRQRVLRCAATLGYQPNRWARSLVTRRTLMIGVVVPDISHSFFAEVTFGVEEVVDGSGYDILLCHSRGDAAREISEINMLIGTRVDGLIVASEQPEDSPELFEQLQERRIPFVLIDRFFPKCNFPTVRVDDGAVGKLATDCLIHLGHTRIAHIYGPPFSPALLRKKAFVEAMKSHGLPVQPQWMVQGDFTREGGIGAMKQLLGAGSRPTAVFAGNDPMAIGALLACRDAGLQVPGDISIVGAGNIEGAHHPNPFLTTVDWERGELGRKAAAMLLLAIQDSSAEVPEPIVFEPRLLIRQSTAAPPSG